MNVFDEVIWICYVSKITNDYIRVRYSWFYIDFIVVSGNWMDRIWIWILPIFHFLMTSANPSLSDSWVSLIIPYSLYKKCLGVLIRDIYCAPLQNADYMLFFEYFLSTGRRWCRSTSSLYWVSGSCKQLRAPVEMRACRVFRKVPYITATPYDS